MPGVGCQLRGLKRPVYFLWLLLTTQVEDTAYGHVLSAAAITQMCNLRNCKQIFQ
jgi:hypothetical protein